MLETADQQVIHAVTAKFQRGDLAGARADCAHFLAVVTDPARQAPLRFWLGAIEQRSGALPAAIEQFELALAVNRRKPPWLVQAGLAHFQSKTLERAETALLAGALQPRCIAAAKAQLGRCPSCV